KAFRLEPRIMSSLEPRQKAEKSPRAVEPEHAGSRLDVVVIEEQERGEISHMIRMAMREEGVADVRRVEAGSIHLMQVPEAQIEKQDLILHADGVSRRPADLVAGPSIGRKRAGT